MRSWRGKCDTAGLCASASDKSLIGFCWRQAIPGEVMRGHNQLEMKIHVFSRVSGKTTQACRCLRLRNVGPQREPRH